MKYYGSVLNTVNKNVKHLWILSVCHPDCPNCGDRGSRKHCSCCSASATRWHCCDADIALTR